MRVRVSIEWFLLDNFIMNAASLLTASALSGLRPRWPAAFLVCLIGALYALFAVWLYPVLLALPIRLLVGALIALGLRFRLLREYIRALLCLYICAFLLGGLLGFLSSYGGESYGIKNGVLLGGISSRLALVSAPLISLAPRLLRRLRTAARRDELRVRVKATLAGAEQEFYALIDTGNLLREPITGLPVMLLSGCADIKDGYPVKYSGVGADGELMCERAECAQVYMQGAWRYIDVMVAKAPMPIPQADAILGELALPPE